MFALNRRTRIFVCKEPTDMRSSYDSLLEKSRQLLLEDPYSGHLFVFLSKRRNSLKALYYDGTGVVIVAKRLESGVFTKLNPLHPGQVTLTQAEFGLFFEGADYKRRFIESPREIKRGGFFDEKCL